MIKRVLAGLLVALLATPSAVFAQAPKAGVVTTLEGNVTARRIALPDPVPLKFKDDVFLQDTVTTGDQSLARMLLGGKAVVTVRERSVLTITEVPGKSTIDLESGKFALAVAREKMRPGEEIQIRTPNAVAGVRGTVVITEVERQGAQTTPGIPAVVTHFFVLRSVITAQRLDAARNPFGTPFQIGEMQSYSGAGLATPRIQPVLPEQLPGITAGLHTTQKHGGGAGGDQVKAQQVQTAVALLSAMAGQRHVPSPREYTHTHYTPLYNTPLYNVCKVSCVDLFKTPPASPSPATPSDFVSFDGDFTSLSPGPLFTLLNGSLTTQTSFRRITQNGNVFLAGPLAKFTSSSIFAGGSLLEIQGGKLKSTGAAALLGVDPTIIATAKSLILMNGGSLTLAGPLLTDLNGTILTGGAFLDMSNGATLSDTSTNPLVQLNGTAIAAASALRMANATMKLAGPLVTLTNLKSVDPATIATALTLLGLNVNALSAVPTFLIDQKSTLTSTGSAPLIQFNTVSLANQENFLRLTNSSSLTLAGSLLKFIDAQIINANVTRSFIAVNDGATLTTTGTSDPLLQFIGSASGKSSVTAALFFFNMAFTATNLSPSMTLAGPFLNAVLTDFRTGDPTKNAFSFLFIGDGTQVKSMSPSPFMTFTTSSVDTAGDVVNLRRSTPTTPTRLTLAGPLVSATNSRFNYTSLGFGRNCCAFLAVDQGAALISAGTSPLLQFTNSTVTGFDALRSGGDLVFLADTFTGANPAELVAPASMTLAGPLLSATNTTITTLFHILDVQRSTLTSTTTSPLITLDGGTVAMGGRNPFDGTTTSGRLVNVNAGGASATPASLILAGPLARLTGTTASATGDVLGIFNGGTVTASGPDALLQLSNTTLSGSNLVNLGGLGGPGGTTRASVTSAGPLLATSNSTITLGRAVLNFFNGSTLTSTTPGPLVGLNDIRLTLGTAGPGLGNLVNFNNTTVSLAGPLLSANNVLLTTGSGATMFLFQNSTVTDTGVDAFINFGGMTVATNDNLLAASGPGTTVALRGSLFKATDTKLTTSSASPRGSFFSIVDGASVTMTGTNEPLLSFIGTASGRSAATAARFFMNLGFNATTLSPSLTLSGPLLTAALTNFQIGDPTANAFPFLFVVDGAQVRSTSTSPFMTFTDSSVDTAGNILTLRRSTASTPTRLTLAGPLLVMTNSTYRHTSLGLGASLGIPPSACCPGFSVQQGAQLTSTTPNALIQLTRSSVIGSDARSGGNFFTVQDTFSGFPSSEVVAPASVSLAGPLLSAANSTVTSLFDTISVIRSTLTSTTSSPLISLSGSTVSVGGVNPIDGSTAFGRILALVSSASSGTPGSPAAMTLAGPLLSATSVSTVNSNGELIGIVNGASLTSTTPSALVSLNNSTLNISAVLGAASVLSVVGFGGPSGTTPAVATLSGPLLSASNGSTLTITGRFLSASNGGQVIESHPTLPFVAIDGGTHSVANTSGFQLFSLVGRSTNTAVDTDPLITTLGSITVGTDQPLQRSGSGAFLQLSNAATLNTQQVFFMDTQLLSASAPVLQATGGSTLTTASDAINLNQQAKLSATGPVFKIDGSTVNITGHAFRVAGGSGLAVTGDFLSIRSGTLNVNGAPLFVSGGSLVNITGAFVNFENGTGSQLNIKNGVCGVSTCSFAGPLPVFVQGGALLGNISVTGTAIKNPTNGTINTFFSGNNGAAIILDGATSKVKIQGL